MQIAQVLAGYSLGGADLLRRAMGKKIKAEMDAQRQTFIDGAVARGVPNRKAADIFELVNKFAGYGFNKSHAAAYALVAYQTAYLKTNYPVEFMAATMSYEMGNTDKLNYFRQELQRLEVVFLPPDINASQVAFAVERENGAEPAVRYGLAAVKNVGAAAMASIVRERNENGPFVSLANFAQRIDARLINKRQVENLARAGAFDALNGNRAQVYAAAETLVRHAAAESSDRESGQGILFGGSGDSASDDLRLPRVDEWPLMDRLRHEFEAIGFYLSAHPLDSFGGHLEKLGVKPFQELLRAGFSGRCKLAGIVIGKRELNSRKGNRMAFVQCSDTGGVFEVTLFSEVLAISREMLDAPDPLLFNVSIEWVSGSEEPRITVNEVEPLEESAAKAAMGIRLYIADVAALCDVRSLLEREGKGRGRVYMTLDLDDRQEVEIELPGGYRLSAAARQAIKAIPGVVVNDL